MEQDFLYDDEEAVKFIKDSLPEEVKGKLSDDDIIYIIDLIYDFYDSMELFEEGDDDRDVEINEDEVVSYVVKNALSDGIGRYDTNDISLVVKGEMDYCESKGIFE
ncbi:MAG: hypothetical protein LBC47_06520 [Tannerella sp.]|jgi:hypothetical protein|nr:hypothetical protein [Tannerella sp.]